MQSSDTGTFRILSLNGGGIRGLYTITVLARLEELAEKTTGIEDYRIGQSFDLIAGTSIGGMLALGLAKGISARELKKVIEKNGEAIFPPQGLLRKKWRQFVGGVYSPDPLEHAAIEVFGKATMNDLEQWALIPAIDTGTGRVKVFKTPHHKTLVADRNIELKDVAMAATAAPTYFPIHEIEDRHFIDAGLVVNCPAGLALHEAMHLLQKRTTDIVLMNVGTMGAPEARVPGRKHKGYFQWGIGKQIIGVGMTASEQLHTDMVRQMLGDRALFIDDHPTAEESRILELDNASEQAIKILRKRGKEQAERINKHPWIQQHIISDLEKKQERAA